MGSTPKLHLIHTTQHHALPTGILSIAAAAYLQRINHTRKRPPLRDIIGSQDEIRLVAAKPPNALRLAARAAVLLAIFLPALLLAPLAALLPPFRRRLYYPLLTDALARAGTAFIKWGQWSSTRPDIFPTSLCAALSRLHSQAPTHSFAHTRALVEEAYRAPLNATFDDFEREPIASGSIAQVHRATLRGQPVAVKVRHPRVIERIVSDFTLMRAVAAAAARLPLLRGLNLKATVSQFSETMVAQTRLDIEAEHLRRFCWNFGRWRDVRFPTVIYGSEAVLVESFEPGELMSRYTLERELGVAAEPPPELDFELAHFVVSRGEDIYLKMLLVDNLMHADLHPGNILLDAGGGGARRRRRGEPQIALIDVGMVARLTTDESQAFIGFLNAMGAGDGAAAARCVLRFSAQQTCANEAAFIGGMRRLFDERCRGYGTGIVFGEVLRGVLGLVREHRVSIDANYMTLVTNVLCLDGMATSLIKGYNVLDAARPLLDAHRLLPRRLFSLGLPLVSALKRWRDVAFVRSRRLSPRRPRLQHQAREP